METEQYLLDINKWFNRTINLDKHWRESKREEKRIRGEERL